MDPRSKLLAWQWSLMDIDQMDDNQLRNELDRRAKLREKAEEDWQQKLAAFIARATDVDPINTATVLEAAQRSLGKSDLALWKTNPERFRVQLGFYYHG